MSELQHQQCLSRSWTNSRNQEGCLYQVSGPWLTFFLAYPPFSDIDILFAYKSLFFHAHVLAFTPFISLLGSDDADRSVVGPDGGTQFIYQVDKDQTGKVTEEKLFGVRVSAKLPSAGRL
jgi:hypothetical protein